MARADGQQPARSRQAKRRQETIAEIKRRAREQLAENGHGGLSLRAVARDMEMSSPAIYRYFPNQNDLITALCVDAFSMLADATEDARDASAGLGHCAQLRAVFSALRLWALTNPADFALTFGTPVPGYHAPREATGPATRRLLATIFGTYTDAVRAGSADPKHHASADSASPGLSLPTEGGATLPQGARMLVHNATVGVLGFIAAESWGSFRDEIEGFDQLWNLHMDTILAGLGFVTSRTE